MKEFMQAHGEAILVVLLPAVVELVNRFTKDWRDRHTKAGRVLWWVIEAVNVITVRKPDLRRDPVSLFNEKEPTEK